MTEPLTARPAIRRGSEPTVRELQILDTYAHTESYVATAARLGISDNTVKVTLHNLRARFGVRSSLGAYRAAVREGYLPRQL